MQHAQTPTISVSLSSFLGALPHCMQESLCESYVERAISLLKRQNEVIAHHPNSHVYSQLQGLVDFEGFYLESEPCLVCNDPEVPYTVSQLVLYFF